MMNKNSFELYVHIPFCKQKCYYCDFLSAPADGEQIAAYREALLGEIRYVSARIRQAENGQPGTVQSVFIGGGTPSYIPEADIAAILAEIRRQFVLESDAEISMECNPGTLTQKKAACYREAGINRISLGLQSTDNACLARIGRIHTWETFLESYAICREAGFDNINIDLMSALPGQTLAEYLNGLQRAADLKPEHISAYSLIVEPGTALETMLANGQTAPLPTEETEREMYEQTGSVLRQQGYHRYEISNYCRPGKECRHNCGYWNQTPYLGFGLGASSFWKETRWQNESGLQAYLAEAGNRDIRRNPEQLSEKDRMAEFMFLGLRMTAGVSAGEFLAQFGVPMEQVYGSVIRKYRDCGLLTEDGDRLCLSGAGINVSNYIFSDFLLE